MCFLFWGGICRVNIFFSPIACFLYKAKDLSHLPPYLYTAFFPVFLLVAHSYSWLVLVSWQLTTSKLIGLYRYFICFWCHPQSLLFLCFHFNYSFMLFNVIWMGYFWTAKTFVLCKRNMVLREMFPLVMNILGTDNIMALLKCWSVNCIDRNTASLFFHVLSWLTR
jgi:hypothetical protein